MKRPFSLIPYSDLDLRLEQRCRARGEGNGWECFYFLSTAASIVEETAPVMLKDGTIYVAEIHWYEAHGIGRQEVKINFPFPD